MTKPLFVAGIDTGVGKSHVTGLLAAFLQQQGLSVTTAKLAQTGSAHPAEDICLHRRLMQSELTPFDQNGTTCAYVFPFPASPHLAARMAGRVIDPGVIDQKLAQLTTRFDCTLLEGVGGLHVPLTDTYTSLDFLAERQFPCLVVSASKLGSINHTLLTVEALLQRAVPVVGIAYSLFTPAPQEIVQDTGCFLQQRFPSIPLVTIPKLPANPPYPPVDFSQLNLNSWLPSGSR